jgi:hypothetical protein
VATCHATVIKVKVTSGLEVYLHTTSIFGHICGTGPENITGVPSYLHASGNHSISCSMSTADVAAHHWYSMPKHFEPNLSGTCTRKGHNIDNWSLMHAIFRHATDNTSGMPLIQRTSGKISAIRVLSLVLDLLFHQSISPL